MPTSPQLFVVGNLTADPELRYAKSGAAVVNFSIATTPRTYDQDTKQYVDGEPSFTRCSAWKEVAENIAASLSKGDRVMAIGVLKSRTYQAKDGSERSVNELAIDEIGPTLKFHTARPEKRGKASPVQNSGSQEQWATSYDDSETPF